MEEWGIFVCVFTLLFIVSLGTLITTFFEHKLLWKNKKFKGVCLDAEIIYFDTVQLDKWSYDITIINYKLNEKSKDAILLKKKQIK